ncbi:MAG TPA: hypothetical protein VFE59_42455 [Trebonia sp.]|nr:hypothetical protein [Trebonia sp.]
MRRGSLPVIAHGPHAVLAWLAAEAAVHRDAEAGQVAGGGGLAPPQAGDPVDGQDDAQVDAGVAGLQVVEGLEEPVVLAAQVAGSGQVQPVHGATGVRHGVVGHPDERSQVTGLVHGPFGEGAVAQVVADQHVLGISRVSLPTGSANRSQAPGAVQANSRRRSPP